MKKNAYIISMWENKKEFKEKVAAGLEEMKRNYFRKYHRKVPNFVLTQWEYTISLDIARSMTRAAEAEARKREAEEARKREEEEKRILALPENRAFRMWKSLEIHLWWTIYHKWEKGLSITENEFAELETACLNFQHAARKRGEANLDYEVIDIDMCGLTDVYNYQGVIMARNLMDNIKELKSKIVFAD